MQCLYEISCGSCLHLRQSTIRQDVGSFSIGGGVGAVRNLGGDGAGGDGRDGGDCGV
jgi:hypothetical protein